MNIKIPLFLFFALFLNFAQAQYKNTNWCFGDSAGIDFNLVNPSPFPSSVNSRGGVVSISDSIGNLLFYAGGTTNALNAQYPKAAAVYSFNHQIMLNGDSIVGSAWYREHVIVPFPNNYQMFYLFSAGVTTNPGFFYSVIDMSLNNGNGAVVQKNVPLQTNNIYANDGIAAIKHGNGRDWWVIIRNWYNQIPNDVYYFYLVSPSGVTLHHTQSIGDMVIPGFFRIEPTDDGSKVATINNKGFTAVYDFDRCSGLLQNENILKHDVITMDADSFPWYWSCTFSPNKQFLYVNGIPFSFNNSPKGYLYQYNLTDSNPVASRYTIDSTLLPESGRWVKLAPDGKIYVATVYENGLVFPYPYPDSIRNYINENLSVINSPDSLGTACNFTPYSFYLGGKRTYGCLPNNPNYALGALVGSVCDTITNLTPNLSHQESGELFLFYHSSWQKLFVNAQNLTGTIYKLKIVDMWGKLIYHSEGSLSPPYFTKDISFINLSKGLYVLSLETNKEKLITKFIKQ